MTATSTKTEKKWSPETAAIVLIILAVFFSVGTVIVYLDLHTRYTKTTGHITDVARWWFADKKAPSGSHPMFRLKYYYYGPSQDMYQGETGFQDGDYLRLSPVAKVLEGKAPGLLIPVYYLRSDPKTSIAYPANILGIPSYLWQGSIASISCFILGIFYASQAAHAKKLRKKRQR